MARPGPDYVVLPVGPPSPSASSTFKWVPMKGPEAPRIHLASPVPAWGQRHHGESEVRGQNARGPFESRRGCCIHVCRSRTTHPPQCHKLAPNQTSRKARKALKIKERTKTSKSRKTEPLVHLPANRAMCFQWHKHARIHLAPPDPTQTTKGCGVQITKCIRHVCCYYHIASPAPAWDMVGRIGSSSKVVGGAG